MRYGFSIQWVSNGRGLVRPSSEKSGKKREMDQIVEPFPKVRSSPPPEDEREEKRRIKRMEKYRKAIAFLYSD